MAWTTFHHRSSYECGICKEGSVHLTLTLTTIFCCRQQTVQLPPVPKPIQLKQSTSPKTVKMATNVFKGNYITTMYFVLCIVCCVVYCLLCITVLHCANNQMHKMFQRKLYNYEFCVMCFVVLCIVCCVSQYCVVPTINCKFFQQNSFFFNKNIKIYFM